MGGGLDIIKLTKTPLIIVFHVSISGAWSFAWGISPPKSPPAATGLIYKIYCFTAIPRDLHRFVFFQPFFCCGRLFRSNVSTIFLLCRFFMYMMLVALGSLTMLGFYQLASSKTKRGKRPAVSHAVNSNGPGFETGTTNGPVDFSWIPKETLDLMSTSKCMSFAS